MLNRRSVILSALVLGAAVALGGCGKSESFRYRMTVEVETPQGLRTGSSVIEVDVHEAGGPFELPEASGSKVRVRGEAVAVDLPGGKVLFALLNKPGGFSGGAAEFPYDALRPSRYQGEYAMIERTRELKGMKKNGILPEAYYPMLVTFGDTSDPTSVEEVNPKDLSAIFGEGTHLRQITIQVTNDPVADSIKKRLNWLSNFPEPGLQKPASRSEQVEGYNYSLAQKLSHGDFWRGR